MRSLWAAPLRERLRAVRALRHGIAANGGRLARSTGRPASEVLSAEIVPLADACRFLPANRSRDLRGLYLAGGAAHPGPGMPMVLMSGWIAADTLDRERARTRPVSVRVSP